MELATPIGAGIIDRLQCVNEALGITDSIPRGMIRDIRDLLEDEPREFLFVKSQRNVTRCGMAYGRVEWKVKSSPLEIVHVHSDHIAVNCLRGIEFFSWMRQGAEWQVSVA